MTGPSTLSRRGALAAGGGLLASIAAAGLTPAQVRPEMRLAPTADFGSWPARKRGPRRTGYQPEPGPRSGASVRWRFLTPRDPTASPGIVATPQQVLAVGASSTFALRPDDGSLAWQTGHRERDPIGRDGRNEFVQSGPQLAAGHALTVADVSLYGLDGSTGSGEWAYATNSSFREVLAVGNTVFLFSLVDGVDRLVALSAETGLPYWQLEERVAPLAYAPDEGLLVTVQLFDDLAEGSFEGRDPATGSQEWSTTIEGMSSLAGSPAVARGRVYLAAGSVYALDATDGTEVWRAPFDTERFGDPVTDGDRVYVTNDQGAAAFDAATGEERWVADVPVNGFATPAVADDRIYLPVEDGVVALATGDGARAFDVSFPGGPPSGMAVADGTLYVRNERGVFALEGER
ncbi:PQQ-binding-like beta-propeller repeat protein [Haloglomus litoreum]|uniref:PQQ-binding-like beta-propeller repeat protein n=1 Tax=Haloglomus litoreum TaxID=3034026 RepID=UPI0023E8F83A|nr:PQQ-binding-like beta-propeller repeat protein [Haloglomus sp. DT116]